MYGLLFYQIVGCAVGAAPTLAIYAFPVGAVILRFTYGEGWKGFFLWRLDGAGTGDP